MGAYDTSFNGYIDVFVSKLSGDLTSLIASTFLGGIDYDEGNSLVFDNDGHIYVTGNTMSHDFPTTAGAYDSSYNSNDASTVFVSKLSSDLTSLMTSTFLCEAGYDDGEFLALDNEGHVYITASTWDNFSTTADAYDISYNGSYDVFVSKLDKNLSASTTIAKGLFRQASG